MRSRKSAISLNTSCQFVSDGLIISVYEGSSMLVEYPDREEMRKIARKVYGDLNERGDIPDEYKVSGPEAAALGQEEPPYVPDGPGDVNCVMRNIIEMLVCNEFCVRRDRHRRRRRRFY